MKKSEIKVGGLYTAKISGKVVTVRVDAIREVTKYRTGPYSGRREASDATVYDVTNLSTGRKTTFRSAAKFRSVASLKGLHPKPDAGPKEPWTLEEDKPLPRPSLASAVKTARENSPAEPPHVVVTARAGTGKTTTLIEGLKRVKGIPSSLTPSPQQAAVWDAMEASRDAQFVGFVAFNKSIADELKSRVPEGCDAMTMHSLGYKAVRNAFGNVRVNSFRIQDIISELLERDIRDLRRQRPTLLKATEELVGLCKANLFSGSEGELDSLCAIYDVECNGDRRDVYALVPRVLERCRDVRRDGSIDFSDMIWLPIVLDLPVFRYDLLLVDEAQDLNRCQQALALKAGRRLVLCGDDRQAIYAFAGADCESLPRMTGILAATARGVIELPLTVTRRCGKAIVREAQALVPDFDFFSNNGEGTVGRETKAKYTSGVNDGDMILSRVNAPLVSQCFRFLQDGRKANIQGRDVGQGLVSTVKKLCKPLEPEHVSIPSLIERLGAWLDSEVAKENAKKNPSDNRLIALQDRHDCLVTFAAATTGTAADVTKKIEAIFTDDKNGSGIRLSSIHKAKGLEAQRVFLLRTKDAPVPHPMARTPQAREQEQNLLYVAITRAIDVLVYVTD